MAAEPDSLILQMLREMRANMATKGDLAGLRSELKSDIKDLGDQIVGLRRAVIEYPTTVIGHGILISELEARLRRVEQHLSLDPMDAH